MGRDRSNLAANLRSFPVKSFVIFYRPANDTVEIVRVLYGARDIESIFRDVPAPGVLPSERTAFNKTRSFTATRRGRYFTRNVYGPEACGPKLVTIMR